MNSATEGLILIDGFNRAILGVVSRCGMEDCLCYSYNAIIEQLTDEGMTHEEAIEYADYNIAGAFVGERTPFILYDTLNKGLDDEY